MKNQSLKTVRIYLSTLNEVVERLNKYKKELHPSLDIVGATGFFFYIRQVGNPKYGYGLNDLKRLYAGNPDEGKVYMKLNPKKVEEYIKIFVQLSLGELCKKGNMFVPASAKKLGDVENKRFINATTRKYITYDDFVEYFLTLTITQNLADQKFAMMRRHYDIFRERSKSPFDANITESPKKKKYRSYSGIIDRSGYNSDPHVSCRLLAKMFGISHTSANKYLNRIDGKMITFKEDVKVLHENAGEAGKYYEDDKIHTFVHKGKLKAHLGRLVKIKPVYERRGIWRSCFIEGQINDKVSFYLSEPVEDKSIVGDNYIEDTMSGIEKSDIFVDSHLPY